MSRENKYVRINSLGFEKRHFLLLVDINMSDESGENVLSKTSGTYPNTRWLYNMTTRSEPTSTLLAVILGSFVQV